MTQQQINKKKIINDPVLGFIKIQSEIIFDLIEHPIFQRLRRIKQLGLSYMVFPGANHTRFEHALGASHLMRQAISELRLKGHKITAILLHDIGHAPFSHVLENTLVEISHEEISLMLMNQLNDHFKGRLDLAIQIFTNQYPKKFLYQLVSGQLDMDRLDYLNRDSFYSGVSEGVVGYDRIINMLDVHNDNIVVEEKGIYSIEKFIVARRLMYWQVYLHKTSLVADLMLKNAVLRAKDLSRTAKLNKDVSGNLNLFLTQKLSETNFADYIDNFAALDDYDIIQALKGWMQSDDKILSTLSTSIINRKLFSIEFLALEKADEKYNSLKQHYSEEEMKYLVLKGAAQNNAYNPAKDNIYIKFKDGSIKEITDITEQWNIRSLSNPVVKHYIAYPKNKF